MVQNDIEARLASPQEIGHWVAWIEFAQTATDAARALTYIGKENSNFIESINPGDDVTASHDYERLVFAAAKEMLVIRRANPYGQTPRTNDVLSARLAARYPVNKRKLTNSSMDEKQKIATVQQMARADALERLGLAKRHYKPKLQLQTGAVAAAGYFRANIRSEFDRRVFDRAPDIEHAANDYRRIWPRRLGSIMVYEAICDFDDDGQGRIDLPGLGDEPLTRHQAFWTEINNDRHRFVEKQQHLAVVGEV